MTLYMMVGLPASGKSTYAHTNLENEHIIYISRDNVRMSIIKDNEAYFSHEDEVFDIFTNSIIENLKNGYDVIADATHISHGSRVKLIASLEAKGMARDQYNIICVVMNTTTDECVERDKLREGRAHVGETLIRNMSRGFKMPWLKEFENVKEVWRING